MNDETMPQPWTWLDRIMLVWRIILLSLLLRAVFRG